MPGPWDTPPTEAERNSVWATPPTEQERAFAEGGEAPRAQTTIGQALMGGIGNAAWSIPSLAGIDEPVAQAFTQALQERVSGKTQDLMGRFHELEPLFRKQRQTAAGEHPIPNLVGNLIGQMAVVGATGAAAQAAQSPAAIAATIPKLAGMSRAQQALALGKAGVIQGGVFASGQPAETPGERLGNIGGGMFAGGMLGGVMGAIAPPAPAAAAAAREMGLPLGRAPEVVQAPRRNILGRAAETTVKPTEEAQFLRGQGVPLTVGQMNPKSPVGQIEEASTSLRHVGATIQAQRNAAKYGWQRVVLNQARPPGMKIVSGEGPVTPEEVDSVYKAFGPAYDAIKGQLVYPAIQANGKGVPLQSFGKSVGALEMASQDPGVLADAATRQTVARYIANQVSLLPEREGAVGKVPVENLLEMRHNLRGAMRSAYRQNKPEMAQLLGNAEQAVTKSMESQLPPEWAQQLRAVDTQYAKFKTVSNAMAATGDSPNGFTPGQLTNAIRRSMSDDAFARGGGGVLRDFSRAGRSVFESVTPPTGARLLTVGPLGEWGTGPALMIANRPGQAANPRVLPPGPQRGVPLGMWGSMTSTPAKDSEPTTEGTGEGAYAMAPSHSTPSASVVATEQIISRLGANPRTRQYAGLLQRAGPAAAGLHMQLYEKDPIYRAALAGKGQTQ